MSNLYQWKNEWGNYNLIHDFIIGIKRGKGPYSQKSVKLKL